MAETEALQHKEEIRRRSIQEEEILNDPEKRAIVEKARLNEELEYKSFRNSVLWVILGILFLFIVFANLDSNNQGAQAAFRRVVTLIGVSAMIGLYSFFKR